jgi:hypothetical protein
MSAGCPVGKRGGLARAGEERNCVRVYEAGNKPSALFRQVKKGIDPLTAREAASAAAKAAAQDTAIKGVTLRDPSQGRPAKTADARPYRL